MARGDTELELELARVRRLAADLASTGSGPAGELAGALTDVVVRLADRVDALWQLIAAVVGAAGPAADGNGNGPPPEFLQALTSTRGSGHAGIRLSLAGSQWVAAVSPDQPAADPAAAWAALERLARSARLPGDQGDDEDRGPDQGGR